MNTQLNSHSVLIIGGGGRESALVYGYGKSPAVSQIYVAPGNDLMQDATTKPVHIFPDISTTDIKKIIELCEKYHITLVDIAQDNAVAAGLGDALEEVGVLFVGPKRAAGQLEWDKAWSRQFMKINEIPHPSFGVFSSAEKAIEYLDQHPNQPWVVKANGLAEGKGVIVTNTTEEAKLAISEMKRFGIAGETFLLEQCLMGEEFSTYLVSDGTHWQVIGSAQDHKRAYDGDTGLNTGGMGCSTPPLLLTKKLNQVIAQKIVKKTIEGMKKIGRPYTGILYVGGMIIETERGLQPYVIEFNARWGDPEAQVIIPGLQIDLFEMNMAVARRNITKIKITVDKKARVVVAGVSKGYPINYSEVKGKQIFGLAKASKVRGVMILGAGVKRVDKNEYANGGRLFYVIGEGKTVIEARKKVYKALSLLSIEGDNLHYRTDIGWRDVKRLS
jgi:phosphoribosylamine--glycine ligase